MAPSLDCEPGHFRPDGAAGINTDVGLTRPPDYPTASQTRARSVPERLSLHTALIISPSSATAGRRHTLGVATAPCTQPYLLEANPHVSFPCLSSLVYPTCLHPFGGFELM